MAHALYRGFLHVIASPFAATALDAEGNESDYSNEVSTVIAEKFRITSMSASMRWFGVVLLCTTSDNASAILRYTDLRTGRRPSWKARSGRNDS